MTWVEKVRRLMGDVPASRIALRAGWKHPSDLSNRLNRGSMPLANVGVELARVLGVPAEWLFDDAQDWPPPTSATPLDEWRATIDAELARMDRRIRALEEAAGGPTPEQVAQAVRRALDAEPRERGRKAQ